MYLTISNTIQSYYNMPKQNTTAGKPSNKLKQQRRKMINTGESDKTIINNINHKKLALQSNTYKKYNK